MSRSEKPPISPAEEARIRDRRRFISNLLTVGAGIAAGGAGLLAPSKARADDGFDTLAPPDPTGFRSPEKGVEWSREELERLADTYSLLSQYRINPDFYLYCMREGINNEVFELLDKMIQNPELLRYEHGADGALLLTPRGAGTIFPPDFKVVVRGSEITEITTPGVAGRSKTIRIPKAYLSWPDCLNALERVGKKKADTLRGIVQEYGDLPKQHLKAKWEGVLQGVESLFARPWWSVHLREIRGSLYSHADRPRKASQSAQDVLNEEIKTAFDGIYEELWNKLPEIFPGQEQSSRKLDIVERLKEEARRRLEQVEQARKAAQQAAQRAKEALAKGGKGKGKGEKLKKEKPVAAPPPQAIKDPVQAKILEKHTRVIMEKIQEVFKQYSAINSNITPVNADAKVAALKASWEEVCKLVEQGNPKESIPGDPGKAAELRTIFDESKFDITTFAQKGRQILNEALSSEDQLFLERSQMLLPHLVGKLMGKRGPLDTTTDDPGQNACVADFTDQLSRHPKNMAEIKTGKMTLTPVVHQEEHPGIFELRTPLKPVPLNVSGARVSAGEVVVKVTLEEEQPVIAFTPDGRVVMQKAPGSTIPPDFLTDPIKVRDLILERLKPRLMPRR